MRAARFTLALGSVLALAACTGSQGGADPVVTTPTSADAEGATATASATPNPAPASDLGAPSQEAIDLAAADVADLTDQQLAGQLVVAAYSGTDPSGAADLVTEHHLAGVITLGANVPEGDPVEPLTQMSAAVNQSVADDGRDWPAFVGIDQEGGPITRVGEPLNQWPAAMAYGAAGDDDLTQRAAFASGEQVRAMGYTAVFAPIADVTTGPNDPTIGVRSPGSDPELVAATAAAQSRGYAEAGLIPVAKHFPGHGSVSSDSHLGQVTQSADLDTLQERDFVPFKSLIEQGAPAIMTAHIVVEAIDDSQPATLSSAVTTDLLRDDLGFDGLVITDALNMQAITDEAQSGPASVQALAAGSDVLLMPADPGATVAAIEEALADGTLEREDLERSAALIVATLRSNDQPIPSSDVIGSNDDLSLEVAAAAITQVGVCGPLAADSIQISGGSEAEQAALARAAEEAGLSIGEGLRVQLVSAQGYQAAGEDSGGITGIVASSDVVVALGAPYPLADLGDEQVGLATFGSNSASMTALADVLSGQAPAPGSLPVAVGDESVGGGLLILCAGRVG